ncbi:MAG: protein-glutamate O-methyltransferase CheR [Solirubrobacteraceae bacterium]|jgi:chemotaxis protein methyltransferase CheR
MSPPAPPRSDALTDAEFLRLSNYFYGRTGIRFQTNKRYFVDKRVIACIEASEAPDFAAWFCRLRLGREQALEQDLLNRLTVHETYFLREDYQLECLVSHVLPAILRERGRRFPVRILSLPCSTGEEPYSIALWLLENWPEIDEIDVSIVGLDIDEESLVAARAGVYGTRAVHRLSNDALERWFDPVRDGYQIKADIRGAVELAAVNVCDTTQMRPYRGYDIVFCRNLLIYFDQAASIRAAENLFGALRPGGYLFLGHTESMSRVSSIFDPVRFPQTTAYQRPWEDEQ